MAGSRAAGGAAVEFGADGVEIHEPALEQRPRHRLQRRVHPPVQLDLVVQRPKHRRDGFLLGERWEVEPQRARRTDIEMLLNSPDEMRCHMVTCDRVDVVSEEAVVELWPTTDNHEVRAVRIGEPLRHYRASARFSRSDNHDIARGEA